MQFGRDSILTLPDFFILGAARCGTTSLYRYLGEHPEIHSPEIKEPWFFSIDPDHAPGMRRPRFRGAVKHLAEYCALYADCEENQICGDGSPSYLFTHGITIPKLKLVYPVEGLDHLRFFILLRNPVDRAWSMYWSLRRLLREDREFEDAIDQQVIAERRERGDLLFYDYIGAGRYCDQLKAYQEAFSPGQIKVILFDDLKQDPTGTCQECFEFLGIDPSFQPDSDKTYNESGRIRNEEVVRFLKLKKLFKAIFKATPSHKVRRLLKRWLGQQVLEKVEMAPGTRRKLQATFVDEILNLQNLIGRDLRHWLT